MKKSFKFIIFVLLIQLFVLNFSFAQGIIKNPVGIETIEELLDAILDWLVKISSVLVVLFIVVGGAFFITAGGDSSKVELGKKTIIFSIVGYLIVLSAKALIEMVASWV
jgi:hypothetical protein